MPGPDVGPDAGPDVGPDQGNSNAQPGLTVTPSTPTVYGLNTQAMSAAGAAGPYTWTTTGGAISSEGVLTAPPGIYGEVQTIIVTATAADGVTSGTTMITVPGNVLTPGDVAAVGNYILDGGDGVGIEPGETLREMLRLVRAIWAGEATPQLNSDGTYTTEFLRADGTTVAFTVVNSAIGKRTGAVVGTLT